MLKSAGCFRLFLDYINMEGNPIKHIKMLKLMANLLTTQPFTVGYVILGSPVESNKHEPQVRK